MGRRPGGPPPPAPPRPALAPATLPSAIPAAPPATALSPKIEATGLTLADPTAWTPTAWSRPRYELAPITFDFSPRPEESPLSFDSGRSDPFASRGVDALLQSVASVRGQLSSLFERVFTSQNGHLSDSPLVFRFATAIGAAISAPQPGVATALHLDPAGGRSSRSGEPSYQLRSSLAELPRSVGRFVTKDWASLNEVQAASGPAAPAAAGAAPVASGPVAPVRESPELPLGEGASLLAAAAGLDGLPIRATDGQQLTLTDSTVGLRSEPLPAGPDDSRDAASDGQQGTTTGGEPALSLSSRPPTGHDGGRRSSVFVRPDFASMGFQLRPTAVTDDPAAGTPLASNLAGLSGPSLPVAPRLGLKSTFRTSDGLRLNAEYQKGLPQDADHAPSDTRIWTGVDFNF